jgi:predicted dehydrogenase
MTSSGGERQLRIGLIGLGKAGIRHADAIRLDRGSVIAAAADPAAAAAATAQELAIPLFDDHRDMLRDSEIDAVVVSVPHHLLSGVALDAASHGVHILLEKPMATRLKDAAEVVRACKANHARLMVNFVHRFRSEAQHAFSAIRSGAIGRPVLAVDIMASGASEIPGWVWHAETGGGGMMMYNGIHGIDRLAWLMDSPITEVSAEAGAYSHAVEVEDSLAGVLRFASGGVGVIVQHKSAAQAAMEPWQTTIYGTDGAVRLGKEGSFQLATAKESVQWQAASDNRFLGAFREFASAIRQDRDPSPSGLDGLRALSTGRALYDASRTTSTVSVPQV